MTVQISVATEDGSQNTVFRMVRRRMVEPGCIALMLLTVG